MENKLQELTDKLYREGLSKGKEEGEALLAKAETKAAEIIETAQAKAKEIIKKAEKDAADYRAKIEGLGPEHPVDKERHREPNAQGHGVK